MFHGDVVVSVSFVLNFKPFISFSDKKNSIEKSKKATLTNNNVDVRNLWFLSTMKIQTKAPFTRDRTNVYPDENSSGLLRLHGSAKRFVHLTFPFTRSKIFVHLTFPFTWELPESIGKAAFRIPTAEIVVHRSTDSNIKTTFLFHGYFFLYGAQRKRGGLPFTRYRTNI